MNIKYPLRMKLESRTRDEAQREACRMDRRSSGIQGVISVTNLKKEIK